MIERTCEKDLRPAMQLFIVARGMRGVVLKYCPHDARTSPEHSGFECRKPRYPR